MNQQILIAGFGGQGVLSMGKMLAEAAMAEGREVTWLPSYGPEMRGGTSSVSVNISDKSIGAPIISRGKASCVIAMNRPSLEKFEDFVAPNGFLFVNSSIIDIKAKRDDVNVFYIPANDIATQLGNSRAANMVMLGAFLAKDPVVKVESIADQLAQVFGEDKKDIVELNKKALEKGAQATE